MTPDLFPSWARRFPFPPRDSVCSPPPSLPLVSLKDLREGGELSRWQQREQGGDERAGPGFLAVREIWRFPTCWKIYVPTCFLLPVSDLEGGGGLHVPKKIHLSFFLVAGPAGSALSSLVGSDPGRSAPRPHARPAGPRVERQRRELPEPALGAHSSGRGVRGGASQGPGAGEEPGTLPTWAAPPWAALERARAKHKQTHARAPSDRGCAAGVRRPPTLTGAATHPPGRPSPSAPPPSPGGDLPFWRRQRGRGLPRSRPSIRSRLRGGPARGRRLLRQVRGTHVPRSIRSRWRPRPRATSLRGLGSSTG